MLTPFPFPFWEGGLLPAARSRSTLPIMASELYLIASRSIVGPIFFQICKKGSLALIEEERYIQGRLLLSTTNTSKDPTHFYQNRTPPGDITPSSPSPNRIASPYWQGFDVTQRPQIIVNDHGAQVSFIYRDRNSPLVITLTVVALIGGYRLRLFPLNPIY